MKSVRRSLFAFLGLFGLGGCLLFGNFDTVRCESTEDCRKKGVLNTVCEQGNCIRTSADGSADALADGVAGGDCVTRADCKGNESGIPTECAANKCVVVQDPAVGCSYLAGRQIFKDPRTVLIGAYAHSTSGGRYAIDQAVEEINGLGGLPSRGASPRPLAVVVCNRDDPSIMTGAAADHMMQTLRVPIVLGQMGAPELAKLSERAEKLDTLLLSTLGNDATLRALPPSQQGRIWYLVDEIEKTAAIYGPALTLAETTARNLRASTTDPIKVALIAAKPTNTLALADILQNASPAILKFNGTDDPSKPTFTRFPNIESKYSVKSADYTAATTALVAAQPAIVIAVVDDELENVIGEIETRWGSGPRPVYIASPLNRFTAKNVKLINDVHLTIGSRFVGVDFSGDKQLLARLDQRMDVAFSPIERFSRRGFNVVYDATWVAALSLVAADENARGTALGQSLTRVFAKTGTPVEVGPPATPDKNPLTILTDPKSAIRLTGTSGIFDVDLDKRARTMGASLYCYDANATLFRLYDVGYDTLTKQLTGTPSCN